MSELDSLNNFIANASDEEFSLACAQMFLGEDAPMEWDYCGNEAYWSLQWMNRRIYIGLDKGGTFYVGWGDGGRIEEGFKTFKKAKSRAEQLVREK